MEFVESFMKFVYPDYDAFLIEQDSLVKDKVKTCECVVLLSPRVAFIEAKSSSPQPKSKEDFDTFINEVRDKFSQSMKTYTEMKDKVYGEDAFLRIPLNLRALQPDSSKYAVYLIVHGNDDSWMVGLQEALKDALRDVMRQYSFKDSHIKALNHTMALEQNIIVGFIPMDELPNIKTGDSEQHRINAIEWFKKHPEA